MYTYISRYIYIYTHYILYICYRAYKSKTRFNANKHTHTHTYIYIYIYTYPDYYVHYNWFIEVFFLSSVVHFMPQRQSWIPRNQVRHVVMFMLHYVKNVGEDFPCHTPTEVSSSNSSLGQSPVECFIWDDVSPPTAGPLDRWSAGLGKAPRPWPPAVPLDSPGQVTTCSLRL